MTDSTKEAGYSAKAGGTKPAPTKPEPNGGPLGLELKGDKTGGSIGVELRGHCILQDSCYKIRVEDQVFHLEPQHQFQGLANKFLTIMGTRTGDVITAKAIRAD